MNSIQQLEKPQSHIKLRVRLWKDLSNETELSPTKTPSGYYSKAALTEATWIKRVDLRFGVAPGFFHLEVSDTGAYSTIQSVVTAGASLSVRVTDITGFEVGEDLVFRNSSGETDKVRIVGIEGDYIYFDRYTYHSYTVTGHETVEDTRWWKFASDYTDSTVQSFVFDKYSDTRPMIAVYGKYFRVMSESVWCATTTVFDLFEDTYFELTPYLYEGLDISKSIDYVRGDAPLTTCNMRLVNVDDRFNPRNTSSPYIVGTVNYLKLLKRVTVEWLGCGPDWEEGTVGGIADWRLLCSFTTRNWQIDWTDPQSIVTLSGETLHRLSTEVDIPLLEVIGVRDIIEDHLLVDNIRLYAEESDGDAVNYRIAVFDYSTLENTISVHKETIGEGTFGNPSQVYADPCDSGDMTYTGFFGIDSDGKYIYTCHSIYADDKGEETRSGALIIRRTMNCLPDSGSSDFMTYIYNQSGQASENIEGGDFVICGDYVFIHTATQGIGIAGFKNVFKLNFTDTNRWVIEASYEKKGGTGHYPVHCVADDSDSDPNNHVLYVLYNGGSEGWTLYKASATDYSTVWTHTFSPDDVKRLKYGYSGMVLIGSSRLIIFTKASDSEKERTAGEFYALLYDLSDIGTKVTYNNRIAMPYGIIGSDSKANSGAYGLASVCQTPVGMLALTGPQIPNNVAKKSQSITADYPQWDGPVGVFANIGKTRFFTQNGRIVNDSDDYTDPTAEKDVANYPIEEVYIGDELQDSDSATYNGTIKTAANYTINLLTGEIQFITPPPRDTIITVSYDYKPNVQYVTSGSKITGANLSRREVIKLPRYKTIQDLAVASGGVVFVDEKERLRFRLRRGYEDYKFTSAAAETYTFRGRDIIHNSNTLYDHNTITVCNEDHNVFYEEGTDYTITYDASKLAYTLTEIGTALSGHIVMYYLTAPNGLVTFDNTGSGNKPNLMTISQNTELGSIINDVKITGQHKFPSMIPMTLVNTYAVSPSSIRVDHGFSKLQLAHPESQYAWDSERNYFDTDVSKNLAATGFIVEFNEPLIVGTPDWNVVEPNTTHIEKKTASATPGGGAEWIKVEWDTPFYEPNTTVGTSAYDVILSNPDYWRVATYQDTETEEWTTTDPDGYYKTGTYIWVKRFSDKGVISDTCDVYAYQTKVTTFHVDKVGTLRESAVESNNNYLATSSPDKKIHIVLEPVDKFGSHLFRTAGTYDGVVIPASMCMSIGSIKIANDGLQMAVYNHADLTHFLRVRVVGYPISTAEIVSVRCRDDYRLDGEPSSMETQGRKPLVMDNQYIQSVTMAKILGYTILDWVKDPHVNVPLTGKFRDDIGLLDIIMIESDYGHFNSGTELWVVINMTHSIRTGLKEMSYTSIGVTDVPNNPSQPITGS